MNAKLPEVSFGVSSFNHRVFLPEVIESVLNQSHQIWKSSLQMIVRHHSVACGRGGRVEYEDSPSQTTGG